MNDPLGEALALLSTEDGLLNEIDRHNAEAYVAAVAEVVAAARNWHTLTNRRDIWWCESHAALAPKPIGGLQGRCDRNLAGKAAPCRIVSVDALTVTADTE